MIFFSNDAGRKASYRAHKDANHANRLALWLLIWFALALLIRLTQLSSKPAWMDEVATTIFSLGNYSKLIPTGEIVSLEQILRPLQVTPGATVRDVVTNLLTEDNHPPTYFVLAHWWISLFQRSGYASLWAQRALPALFGALAVPMAYWLAWVSFRDRLTGLLCAALMAISPFAVFLSQEARHYTLAILAVMASLGCFALAARALQQQKELSWRTVLIWVVVNVLGLTIHYFCGLTIIAEGMTLLALLIWQCQHSWRRAAQSDWLRIYAAAAGTLAGGLLWLPILLNFYGSPQTTFLKPAGQKSWQFWINPIVQSLASWLYAVLSPITRGYSWQAIIVIAISCAVLLVYAIWLVAVLQRSLRYQLNQPRFRAGIVAMGGFFIMANALFLIICYALGFDITRGHRYSFVFFPSILMLVGVGLALFWRSPTASLPAHFRQIKLPLIKRSISGRAFVATVIGVGFIGAQIIVNDLSSLKFYKADRLVNLILTDSKLPVVIGTQATVTEQPSVIGIEIMSVAWEIERHFNPDLNSKSPDERWVSPPRFVIAEENASKNINAEAQLIASLAEVARPFDLWLLNMAPDLEQESCRMPTGGGGNKGSFSYVHYVCDQPAQPNKSNKNQATT
jgi:uncharacterized membrane protein